MDVSRIEHFTETGLAFPFVLYDGDDAANLKGRYDAFQEQSRTSRGRETFIKPHLLARWAHDIAVDFRILDLVEHILGPDIMLWSSDFFVKAAGKGTYVTWHQDTPFWHLDPLDKTVSVWVCITPSTVESGCMKAAPGSHRDGDLTTEWRSKEGGASQEDLLSRQQMLSRDFSDDDALDVELSPGQFSIHHGLTVHGGQPNPADYDRIGFVLRFITPDTRQLKAEDSAMLVRGEDRFGLYLHETPPDEDFSPAAIRQIDEVYARPSGFNDMVVK